MPVNQGFYVKYLVQEYGHGAESRKGKYYHVYASQERQRQPVAMHKYAEACARQDDGAGNEPYYPFQVPFVSGCSIHISASVNETANLHGKVLSSTYEVIKTFFKDAAAIKI